MTALATSGIILSLTPLLNIVGEVVVLTSALPEADSSYMPVIKDLKIDLFANTRPDLAIVDIKMPGMNGIEVTKELKTNYNDAKIIALTMFNNDFLLSEMLNANTNGYLLKTATREEILNAIKVVYEGGVFYCRETAAKMKKHFSQLKTTNYKEEKQVIFTPREIEIINLICQQLTTKEIATQLNISDRTVDSHRNLILQKIDAKNMVGIVLYAIKHELFKL